MKRVRYDDGATRRHVGCFPVGPCHALEARPDIHVAVRNKVIVAAICPHAPMTLRDGDSFFAYAEFDSPALCPPRRGAGCTYR
jgi:hypothetical protein